MKKDYRKLARLLSGMLGFFLPVLFSWKIYQSHAPQNIATWGMFFVLDSLGLILVIKNGNEEPYLQAGWTFSALCVMLAVIFGGNSWNWGGTETASSIVCGFAIFLWLKKSAKVALWAFPFAMVTSFIPLLKDYWMKPQPESIWLWEWTIVACALSIYGAKKRNFSSALVPGVAAFLNGVVVVLCRI